MGHFAPRLGIHSNLKVRWRHVFMHSFYTSLGHFVTNNSALFQTVTMPGRILRTTYSFTILLIVSAYVANLAAVLSVQNVPVGLINSISDFPAQNAKACVLNNSAAFTFARTYYPSVDLLPVNGYDVSDVVQAVQNPNVPCSGAIAADVDAEFLFGEKGDPLGSLCSYAIVGANLNQGFIGVAFNRYMPLAQLSALNGIISQAIESGAYNAAMQAEKSLSRYRGSCPPPPGAVSGSATLTLTQFAGIFAVLALGASVALVIKVGGMIRHNGGRAAMGVISRSSTLRGALARSSTLFANSPLGSRKGQRSSSEGGCGDGDLAAALAAVEEALAAAQAAKAQADAAFLRTTAQLRGALRARAFAEGSISARIPFFGVGDAEAAPASDVVGVQQQQPQQQQQPLA